MTNRKKDFSKYDYKYSDIYITEDQGKKCKQPPSIRPFDTMVEAKNYLAQYDLKKFKENCSESGNAECLQKKRMFLKFGEVGELTAYDIYYKRTRTLKT